MPEDEMILKWAGLEQNNEDMKRGLEQFVEAVDKINKAVDDSPNNWKGATQTAYMEQYNELKPKLRKDVPDAVNGMITFLENFMKNMKSCDEDAANSIRG